MTEVPFEGPAEDVAEQRVEVTPEPGRRAAGGDEPRWDADPADAAEQHDEVPIDEDEWR